jgi:hypothetical protein
LQAQQGRDDFLLVLRLEGLFYPADSIGQQRVESRQEFGRDEGTKVVGEYFEGARIKDRNHGVPPGASGHTFRAEA